MTTQPSVIAGILLGYEAFLSKRGVSARDLFQKVGICTKAVCNPQIDIPAQAVADLWEEAARVTGEPCLALDWAEAVPVGATGPFFYLFLNSNTFGEAMQTAAQHTALLRQAVDLKYEADADGARIWWQWPRGFDGPYTQASAFSAALFVLRARLITAPDWTPVRVELQGEPLLCANRARWMFGPDIVYRAPRNAIHVDAETAMRPIGQADPRMRHILQSVSRTLISSAHGTAPFATEVQGIIATLLSDRRATLEEVARILGCSPRTLQNRLTHCGTSFESLVNDMRRSSAEDLLRLGGSSMSQISGKLGFSELSAFTRAAQRWFGMSPTAYRRKIKG